MRVCRDTPGPRIVLSREVAAARCIARHVAGAPEKIAALDALTNNLGLLPARDWLIELAELAELYRQAKAGQFTELVTDGSES